MVGHRPARALKEAWAVHTGLNGAWTDGGRSDE